MPDPVPIPDPVPVPVDPDYISSADFSTWAAVDAQLLRKEPVSAADRAVWASVNTRLVHKAETFVSSQNWLSPTTMKIVAGVLAVVMMLLGAGTVGNMMGRRNEPAPVPTPTPVVPVVTDGDKIAQAMTAMGANIGTAIDKQTAAIIAVPVPTPGPGPSPTPPGPEPTKQNPIVLTVFDSSGKVITDGAVQVGDQVRVSAKSLTEIRWVIPTSKIAKVFASGQDAIITPTAAGEIHIGGVCLVDGKVSTFTFTKLVISGQGPQPPPDPIKPVADPVLLSLMQTAWLLDGKPAQISQLAAVYRASGTIVNDAANKTAYDVFATMHKSIGIALAEPDAAKVTVLPTVRNAIAMELNKTLPTGAASSQPLTDDGRKLIAAQFLRIQLALESVVK